MQYAWYHLDNEEETTLICLVHQDVSDLSEHSLPWVGALCSSAYRGPWWAWRASYHAIHPLPLPLVDIEDITFNVIQFELTGMHGSMQLCERLP